MGLDRGFGDCILAIARACTGAVAFSSSEDSDSDDEDEDSSSSSKNSNTLGTFFAGSLGWSSGASGAGGPFTVCFDALTRSVGDDRLLVEIFGLCPGPAWVTVVELETVDEVLFLPSLGFLERRL